jgi:H+/Cl- antiporter ClcA
VTVILNRLINITFWADNFKWIGLFLTIGILSGCGSAFFLVALEWVSHYRELNKNIYFLLPIGGFLIGIVYYFYGKSVSKGNDLLIEKYHYPTQKIPLKMFPFILISTLVTHLFGGSAGREGTAVQMSTAISNAFSRWIDDNRCNQRMLIILGISGGFSSVFGTPLAGSVFALEIMCFQNLNFKTIIGSFITAFIAYVTVEFWQVKHTVYVIYESPTIGFDILFWIILSGVIFGLTALLFVKNNLFWRSTFNKYISYPPLRPLIGGLILVIIFCADFTKPYMGLGLSTIQQAFINPATSYDFILKLLLTGFTLGSGFKGGEVTPLFFVGTTLGSFLALNFNLPLSLLAGLGFIAVFCGATHTPFASILLGLELFGIANVWLILIVCFTTYFCSGNASIYHSQFKNVPKYYWFFELKQFFITKKIKNVIINLYLKSK